MRQNNILKMGDLVRYKVPSVDLDELGFVLGQIYEVKTYLNTLVVETKEQGLGSALDIGGVLTKAAYNFTIVKCPVTLPRGRF